MGFSSAVTSPVDRMYRGYTKKDVFATMWIDAVPSVLFPILCAKFTSRPNPIKMLRQWGIPFFIFGTVLEYLHIFAVQAKKDASFEDSCIGNIAIISISVDIKCDFYTFSGTRYAAFICPYIPSFPLFCAFATLLRTISNLGTQVADMLINHLRKMLEDKTNKCNGETFGART